MQAQDILGLKGLIQEYGYGYRAQQLHMAEFIEDCIDNAVHGIVEAGTGTGKSFAYLVPAILSGKRVIVSTANKTLQSQLITKDLPKLQEMLPVKFRFVVAKGKANYVCLDKVQQGGPALIEDWLRTTLTGDIDEAPVVLNPEDKKQVCAGDDCTRKACPFYSRCYYYAAARARYDADVVVTNHAQLCRHLLTGHVLPDAQVLIVDEAHQLESYAISANSIAISPFSFPPDLRALGQDFLTGLPEGLIPPEATICHEISDKLAEINADLEPGEPDDSMSDAVRREMGRQNAYVQRMRNLQDHVYALVSPTRPGFVRHMEKRQDYFVGKVTQYDVSDMLSHLTFDYPTTIYTSATMATNGGYDYFKARNGIAEAQTLTLSSPFDYAQQCALYLPMSDGMPSPTKARPAYDRQVQRQMYALVQASGGGALLLFTSWRAMREAYQTLSQHLGYPLCMQGQMNKQTLIDWLKAGTDRVLLATASFWEGVDIPGDALRLVAIDKLPFAAQSPVEQARRAPLGKRAFIDLQVPEATLKLKQGFGRLIRSVNDRGVVAILDPRLWERNSYGRRVIAALPDAQVVTCIDDAMPYLEEPLPMPPFEMIASLLMEE